MSESVDVQPRPVGAVRKRPGPRSDGVRAVDVVLAAITQRIASGAWTAESIPTVMQMREELGCGNHTLGKALRLLRERGVVHKVPVLLPQPGSRNWVWRPTAVSEGQSLMPAEASLAEVMAEQIRSGALSGPLPSIPEMARRYRVHQGTMQTAYEGLVAQGLVRRVWLPDFTRLVWYVIDGREPGWLPPGEGTKADAIVADLMRWLPEWQWLEGTTTRSPVLPPVEQLRKRYRTSWACVAEALRRLVAEGWLLEVPGSGRSRVAYLPVPGRDDSGGRRSQVVCPVVPGCSDSVDVPDNSDLVDTEEL